MRVLQIAGVGPDVEPVMVGVREYPVSQLCLLHTPEFEKEAGKIAKSLAVLNLPVRLYPIGGKQVLMETLRVVTEIVRTEGPRYDDVVINVASGDRMLSCATLSAAFVNGVRAVGVHDGTCFNLPVLKFSYTELVSEPKTRVLEALSRAGGEVASLQQLCDLAGMDKSLLSYHLRGARESRGLESLGLVEIDRALQGRLAIRITPMGRLMLLGI